MTRSGYPIEVYVECHFDAHGAAWVTVAAPTPRLCQRIAFEVGSRLPRQLVGAPSQGTFRGEQLWRTVFMCVRVEAETLRDAVGAGVARMTELQRELDCTPSRPTPPDLLEP